MVIAVVSTTYVPSAGAKPAACAGEDVVTTRAAGTSTAAVSQLETLMARIGMLPCDRWPTPQVRDGAS